MNTIKAFHVVGNMIAEHENCIEDCQQFINENKGNPKMKDAVVDKKQIMQKARTELKPLYRIRNAFYGV